jgi:Zinc finger C-x8-C-x5-C-x3-H type (and similar)
VNDDDPGEGSEEYYGTQDMWVNGNGYGGSGYSSGSGYAYGYGYGGGAYGGGGQYNAPLHGHAYKTQLCYSFTNTGACPKGPHCSYAHGHHELVGSALVPVTRSVPALTFNLYLFPMPAFRLERAPAMRHQPECRGHVTVQVAG